MVSVSIRLLLVLASLGTGIPAAVAQNNFQPGYIVQLSGDSVRGEVDVRGKQRMSRLCLFRTAAGAALTQFTPRELKAYGLRQGARYEARAVAAVGAESSALAAGTGVFMEVLAQGKAMLYTYPDADDRTHYGFRQADGPLVELVQTAQTVQVKGLPVKEQTFPFRQVLSAAFADCPAVQPRLVKAVLTDSQLIDIFNRYNYCGLADAARPQTTVRTSTLHFGLVLGLQQATASLNDKGVVEAKSAPGPVVGVGALLNPAAFNSKLAIRIEALYQSQLLEADYVRNNGVVATLRSNRHASIRLKTVRVPLLLRYTVLPAGALRPYLQAGAELAVLLNRQLAVIQESNEGLNGTYSTTTRNIEMRGLGIGPAAALGVLAPTKAGTFQLEARYSQLDSASEILNQLGGAQTIFLLLGYSPGR